MALWYAINSPLDFVLFGDRAASASPQRRRSPSPSAQPHNTTLRAAGNVDVLEHTAAYEFIADAPGFSPSDISVDLQGKVLTISGKQQQERKEQQQPAKEQQQQQQQQQQVPAKEQQQQQQVLAKEQQQQQQVAQVPEPEVKVWRSERRLRQFSRSFQLPNDADTQDITASLDNGVLTVRVAKLPPPPKPVLRHIAVQSAAVPAC